LSDTVNKTASLSRLKDGFGLHDVALRTTLLGADVEVWNDPEMQMVIRLRIHGRVQGVWYRGWLVEEASGRGLDGWVRNRTDGSVEALVAGDEATVRVLIERCKEGPSQARVALVEQHPESEPPAPGFVQRPTL
jgi:acylphosphatase